MLLIAHPTGNANFRAAASAFFARRWLQELHSCVCWNENSPLAKYLPSQVNNQLKRRSFLEIPLNLQHSHPWRELCRVITADLNLPWLQSHEIGPFSRDAVHISFDRYVSSRLKRLQNLRVVYAYEDGAFKSFQEANKLGIRRIYDLPIGYWRAAQETFAEERELQPGWACTLDGLKDSSAKNRRKEQELLFADLVIVPSQFVKSTLSSSEVDASQIAVIPYGSPPALIEPTTPKLGFPLRVLYVGSLGQRKGLSYALDAIDALGSQVSLTLIGKPSSRECQQLNSALLRHHWIASLSHELVLEQMRKHDVLIFPTLFDGFGLVITEALSQGLPVITTPNGGGPECIRDGIEGFIVPIRNSLAIIERLQQLIDDRELLLAMRYACLSRASELNWSQYQEGLALAVEPFLKY